MIVYLLLLVMAMAGATATNRLELVTKLKDEKFVRTAGWDDIVDLMKQIGNDYKDAALGPIKTLIKLDDISVEHCEDYRYLAFIHSYPISFQESSIKKFVLEQSKKQLTLCDEVADKRFSRYLRELDGGRVEEALDRYAGHLPTFEQAHQYTYRDAIKALKGLDREGFKGGPMRVLRCCQSLLEFYGNFYGATALLRPDDYVPNGKRRKYNAQERACRLLIRSDFDRSLREQLSQIGGFSFIQLVTGLKLNDEQLFREEWPVTIDKVEEILFKEFALRWPPNSFEEFIGVWMRRCEETRKLSSFIWMINSELAPELSLGTKRALHRTKICNYLPRTSQEVADLEAKYEKSRSLRTKIMSKLPTCFGAS